MKLEMRVDGSTVSKVHGVRRLNTQVNPNELQTERPVGECRSSALINSTD